VLNTHISSGMLARDAAFIIYNFPNLLLPTAILGVLGAGRLGVPPLARWALLAGLILHAVFSLRYDVKDQYTFFVPMYVMLSIFGGLGAALVLGWRGGIARTLLLRMGVVLLVLTPAWYALVPRVARHFAVLERFPQRPYRDSYVYLFSPWSIAESSAERMSNEAVSLAGRDGVIFLEDGMGAFALRFKKIRRGYDRLIVASLPDMNRPDGRARFDDLVRRTAGGLRPVVLVPTDARHSPPDVSPGLGWARKGDLFILQLSAPPSKSAPAT
jgi:hypothetical protein